MSGVGQPRRPQTRAECIDGSGEEWPWRIVEIFFFAHVAASPECVGWTYGVDGYGRCGRCDWSISARTDLGDDRARGRFGLAALAMIGATFAKLVVGEFS